MAFCLIISRKSRWQLLTVPSTKAGEWLGEGLPAASQKGGYIPCWFTTFVQSFWMKWTCQDMGSQNDRLFARLVSDLALDSLPATGSLELALKLPWADWPSLFNVLFGSCSKLSWTRLFYKVGSKRRPGWAEAVVTGSTPAPQRGRKKVKKDEGGGVERNTTCVLLICFSLFGFLSCFVLIIGC